MKQVKILQIVLISPDVSLPKAANPGDAGLDLRANEDWTLLPGERRVIGTGLRVAIPEGYAGLILPRSGLASKHGLTVANSPGLIDSGYRGEVGIALINHGPSSMNVMKGDRIAQLLVVPFAEVEPMEVEALDESERGEGGFGSTGV